MRKVYEEKGIKPDRYCVDCGRLIGKNSIRCWGCHIAYRKSDEYRNLQSERIKAAHEKGCYDSAPQAISEAHARGCYNGTYQSPTAPERDIISILEALDESFEFNQFRLASYSYDFYLPERNLIIEYDGWFWHDSNQAAENGRVEMDLMKNKLAKRNGFTLVRFKGSDRQDLTYYELFVAILYVLALNPSVVPGKIL